MVQVERAAVVQITTHYNVDVQKRISTTADDHAGLQISQIYIKKETGATIP